VETPIEMNPSPRISLPRGARYEAPGGVVRTTILYEDGTEIVITADDDGERLVTNRQMEQRDDGIWRVRR
jgi:hypothetical protein